MHRFFAPALDAGDETVVLPKDEAEHLRRVLRLGVGDTVSVFDGRGHEFLGARDRRAPTRNARAAAVARRAAAESSVPITLVQAVLKGDKMDDIVRDAVMLGVSAIQPLVTKRTEIDGRGAAARRTHRALASRRARVGQAVAAGGAAGHPNAAQLRELPRRAARRPAVDARRARRARRRRTAVGAQARTGPVRRRRSGSDRKAAGTSASGRARTSVACVSSRSASARCVPTPCRWPSSASCRSCGNTDVRAGSC